MSFLPLYARTFLIDRVREGGRFRRILAELESHERWSGDAARKYQEAKLAQVFKWCRRVPYYAEQLDAWRVGRGSALEALNRLPLLDKGIVRSRNNEFHARGLAGLLALKGHTSGTTGTPMTCWRDVEAIRFENASLWRIFRWAGVELNDRRAVMRGDMVVPATQNEPPFWTRASSKVMLLSLYHLSPRYLPGYLEALRQFAPATIESVPSGLATLASWMVEHGETLQLKAAITSSESLLDEQRNRMERAFSCPVIDYYGNSERTVLLARCERGAYHVLWDYAVTEFLPDERGDLEVVGTALMNRVMPLLRYRSGDRIEAGITGERCPCGRTFPVCGRPEGRLDAYILTPDGRYIGRVERTLTGLHHIREAQFIQTAIDRLVIRVVGAPEFNDEDTRTLVERARNWISPELQVSVELVESIPRGPRGKFAIIVSNLPPSQV
ncbi:MAG: hypothetical protein QME66_07965 [Candidatus Eisenbacteria bacterium]|nr:hypothetical protein [Candidatus Eisenbacteria bacterium]